RADAEILQATYLLNPSQISQLINYRNRFGSLLSLYELQAVPEFDLQTIENLAPFVTIGDSGLKGRSFWERLKAEEQAYVLLRHQRTWENRKGFSLADTSSTGTVSSRYLGDPNTVYLR